MIPTIALLAPALLACGSPPADTGDPGDGGVAGPLPADHFAAEYAEAVCSWYEDCGVLVEVYETWEDCLRHYEDAMNTYVDQAACDYDPALGRACVDEIATIPCDKAGYHWSDDSPCLSMCGE